MLHLDHTSFSNVFVLHLPECRRILIVELRQNLSVGSGTGVEHLWPRLWVSHIRGSDVSEGERPVTQLTHYPGWRALPTSSCPASSGN